MERSSIRGGQGRDASGGRPGRDGNKRECFQQMERSSVGRETYGEGWRGLGGVWADSQPEARMHNGSKC